MQGAKIQNMSNNKNKSLKAKRNQEIEFAKSIDKLCELTEGELEELEMFSSLNEKDLNELFLIRDKYHKQHVEAVKQRDKKKQLLLKINYDKEFRDFLKSKTKNP